jgi:pimeloyl-ACP methyl ester carboxylesterase
VRPNPLASAHAPVQLIVPTRDRFISASYYDAAARVASGMRRREVDATHWAQLAQPDVVAGWVAEFAQEREAAARGASAAAT